MPDSQPTLSLGLTEQQVLESRKLHGRNLPTSDRKSSLLLSMLHLLREPMFILLLLASGIYFFSGSTGEGIFMLSALLFVGAINLFQENRSQKALMALNDLTAPAATVIRGGKTFTVPTEEIVVGDLVQIAEGNSVPADGKLVEAFDLTINESVLTGESLPVQKFIDQNSQVFRGTTVVSGSGILCVETIGDKTQLGKVGVKLRTVESSPSPLQVKITKFVQRMAIIGVVFFIAIWLIHFLHTHLFLASLLNALTLAMSILPEEIPVAFTTFMALGSIRLMKSGIIVRQINTVESLGSATVICVDKTGTITQNKMSVAGVFDASTRQIHKPEDPLALSVVEYAMWASETRPFDPMEVAIHHLYDTLGVDKRTVYKMIHEYPLGGTPPMMTHGFQNESANILIGSKGAPEAYLTLPNLDPQVKVAAENALKTFAAAGYRVLGVASAAVPTPWPATQQELSFTFLGLIAFFDPPKPNIREVFNKFYQAGIQIKMITGDNSLTAKTIADMAGLRNTTQVVTGNDLIALSDSDLKTKIQDVNLFTRMFPEAKLRVIQQLIKEGEVVAMTGDGVNDGPALKAAHIGVAMGAGSETARQSAALVLVDGDLMSMVTAIEAGRKIYANLRKAIQYIISIHIPIILTVFLPLMLGWLYPVIFTPMHVIFLEIIMGPTCSVIYENEPIESYLMRERPRKMNTSFFSARELSGSVLQGLVITIGILFVYHWGIRQGASEAGVRTLVFITLITANIFLTLVNRSFYYSIIHTLHYKNNLVAIIIGATVVLTTALLVVPPFSRFFSFMVPDWKHILVAIGIGAGSVLWYEVVKWRTRLRKPDLRS